MLGLEVARAAAAAARPTLATLAAQEPGVSVIGIEMNAAAVYDANRNAMANGLHPPRYRAVCAKVEDGIEAALGACQSTDRIVAILDPPRTGLSPSVCKALRQARGINRIVFVSCNPHGHTLRHDFVVKGGSLAANVKILTGPRGRGSPFRLVRGIPVDMFPHTPHVELCLLLERPLPSVLGAPASMSN